jgi:predicted unusual protein kinase regulating ubiquinone biosynthesis (AarF/ABC1/UbiB family)
VADRDKAIPTGRVRRTAKVGGLVGGQAARAYATKAANVARSEEGRRSADERRQAEAAEQIVEVLGQMKGAAMKAGQVASFIDIGALGPEAQERFHAKLAELRDSAPRVSFEDMREVIESDLGEPLENAFDEFEEQAIAAASIGQVYRARLHDGRRVAVKVQYPGVASAVRADLQNLGLILLVAKRIAPGLDAKALGAELRERLGEELDYEHEAQSQRTFARAWRGHPFVVIPDVVTSMCGERVLVSEYVEGLGFEGVKRLMEPERDRFGEIVFRFFLGSYHRTRHFSGDPHPGNYVLMEDGRVAFLDFGMTKQVSRAHVELELEALRSAHAGDAASLRATLVRMGLYAADDPVVTPERLLEHFRAITGWYLEDVERRLDPAYVGQVLIDMGDPRSSYWDMLRRATMPADALLARRMETLTLGVLAQLRACANWHRIAGEWLFGSAPATPLGEAESRWMARAGDRFEAEGGRRSADRIA